MAVADGTGAVIDRFAWDMYGNPAMVTGDQTYGFTGHGWDEGASLHQARARWYDPDIGRFLSEDPIPAINQHGYADGDPANLTDPLGLVAAVSEGILTSDDAPQATATAQVGTRTTGLFSKLTHSMQGIKPYRVHAKFTAGHGGRIQAHHLIERRFLRQMGGTVRDWPSVVVTRAEHQAFTNAWRAHIPYGSGGTGTATRASIEAAAREIYRDYPTILRALGLL